MIKLLVFDLDGTLVDTLHDLAGSVNFALGKIGFHPLPIDRIKVCIGDGARKLIERTLLAAEQRARPDISFSSESNWVDQGKLDFVLAEFLIHYSSHCMVETIPYNGVRESLNRLQGFKKAVLTNKPTGLANQILDGLNLASHFSWVFGGDNEFGPKPNPLALNHIISLAGCDSLQTLMIGDGIQDFRVAQNAKTHFLGFLSGLGDPGALMTEGPKAILEDMHFLPEAIASFQNSPNPISGNRKIPSGDRQ